MSFDILNPRISRVAKGLEGKVILICGSNNLGKTKQSTRLEKPFYLPFEEGLNAIDGVPFLPIGNWSDFKKINKQLTDKKKLSKIKEVYQTIILDEVYTASVSCQDFICVKYGAETLTDKIEGVTANLYQAYEKEFLREINKLLKAGFTVVFLGHEEYDKDSKKIRPKGDKRSMGVIVDKADIVVHLQSNGVDEFGKPIKSSAFLAETDEFFARSRFDYMETYIEEFTAENFTRVVIEGIERQEEIEGIKSVSFETQHKEREVSEADFDTVLDQIKSLGKLIAEKGYASKVSEAIEEHVGNGIKSSDLEKKHTQAMSVVVAELQEICEDLGIDID